MDVKEWLPSQLPQDIWNNKYRYDGETFDNWLERVSNGNNELQQLILEKKFIFAGRILANRGIPQKYGKKGTYSNCYVMAHPEDNIEDIFRFGYEIARTYSYGGGCGGDLSALAPINAKVNNAAERSSGAVSFMPLLSIITETIAQKGRRGALMLSMVCSHPDIFEFVKIKSDLEKVTKANISVRFTDKFLTAVENNEQWTLSFTRKETGETIKRIIKAEDLIREIAFQNWDIAEPGAMFWDRILNWNLLTLDPEGQPDGTNPCGEEPLMAGGSCLLCAINLSELVTDPFTDNAKFNLAEFKEVVKKAVIYMNEVLDEGLDLHALPIQRETARKYRQIGIGEMGLADMFIKMGISYGSQRSIELVHQIGKAWINSALQQSALLAKEFGTYLAYNEDYILNSPFFKENATVETFKLVKQYGLRNSQLLTIAPTGSLSTMWEISGGIEPIFDIAYYRKTESLHDEVTYYKVLTKIVAEVAGTEEYKEGMSLPHYVVTSREIPWKDRVDVQAAFQYYIDASISSTVNLPKEATVEDVWQLYMYAWKQGCKGITVYRSGCRREGVLTTEEKAEVEESLARGFIEPVRDNLIGLKRKLVTGCGSLWCMAYFDINTGELKETFLSKGSSGGCNSFMNFASRLLSLATRGGISASDIFEQSQSIPVCPSYAVRKATKKDTSLGASCPTAIGNAIMEMIGEMHEIVNGDEKKPIKDHICIACERQDKLDDNKCPDCGKELSNMGGCIQCRYCGWSQCG